MAGLAEDLCCRTCTANIIRAAYLNMEITQRQYLEERRPDRNHIVVVLVENLPNEWLEPNPQLDLFVYGPMLRP